MRALRESVGILGTCIKEAPEFAGRRDRAHVVTRIGMTDINIRSDNVDVEQIMRQIRARIREKRGVDYTEEEIRELAAVKLETFLDPRGVRSDLLEQFRRKRDAALPPNFAFEDSTIYDTHRCGSALHPPVC